MNFKQFFVLFFIQPVKSNLIEDSCQTKTIRKKFKKSEYFSDEEE